MVTSIPNDPKVRGKPAMKNIVKPGEVLKTAKKEFEVENPLGIKGLDGNDQSIDLAELLINLQHFRNPYIHPEISEMEKTTIIREATVKCLKMICKLQ